MSDLPWNRLGQPCAPDTPTHSECGYPPQYYCAPSGGLRGRR